MADNNNEKTYAFNKFMNDIIRREEAAREDQKKYAEEHADTPQRRYNELYRERWQNRIKWGNRGQ